MSSFGNSCSEYGNDVLNKNESVSQIDVLICGACTFHCSDIKEFTCHKQICQKERKSSPEKLIVHKDPSPIIFSAPITTIADFPVSNAHTSFATVVASLENSCKIVSEECSPHSPGPKNTATKLLYETFSDSSGNHYLIENHVAGRSIAGKDEIVITAENDEPSILMLSEEPNWENELAQAKKITLAEKTDDDMAKFIGAEVLTLKEDTINIDTLSPTDCCEVELQSCLELPNTVKKTQTISNTVDAKSSEPNDPNLSTAKKSILKLFEMVDSSYMCSFDGCKYVTKHKKNMGRHSTIHTGEKRYPCKFCGTRFSRQDKQRVHEKIHMNMKFHVCPEPGCTYRSVDGNGLTKHKRTHTNERPYECQLCVYSARDSSQLSVHLRCHTGDTPFHCQTTGCASTFATSSDLKRHEIIHSGLKPFKCPYCSYAANLKHNLNVHIKLLHSEGAKYVCSKCQTKCSTAKQLKEHRKTHRNVVAKRKGANRVKLESLCNYVCEECGSTFVRNDSYTSHIRQHQQLKYPANKSEAPLSRKLIIKESNFAYAKHPTSTDSNIIEGKSTEQVKTDEIFVSYSISDPIDEVANAYLNTKSPTVTDYSF